VKAERIYSFLGVLIIILLAFGIIWNAGIIGVAAGSLEKDAREEQQISGDWEMAQAVNDDMCAMLFYDEALDDCIYSVYMKRDGASYGYFFSQGGRDAYIKDSVRGIIYEDTGIALMSLNADKVCRIVAKDDAADRVIDVEPDKPFVVLLPVDSGEIKMYNAEGNLVTFYDTYK